MAREIIEKDLQPVAQLLRDVVGADAYRSMERMGGLTNRTYHVTLEDGREFVVRIPGEGTEELIVRNDERVSTELACRLGVDAQMLHFGADGRYTSGDPELDVLVAETLNTIITENPELEGLDLLRKVFDHCYQDYKYLRKDAYDFGATGWEVADAKEMLQKGRGNCYNFAAIFWALAQGMGYDVQCLAGTCTGTDQPHGWVVLKYEAVYYFVDPEWQYAYTEREIYDKDMFMLTMDEVWWWTYRWDNTQFAG